MYRIFTKYSVFLLLLCMIISSCKKKDAPIPIQVLITSPTEGEIFNIPDTIWVRFSIESEQPIQNLRLSIDNENLIPISNKVYLTPEDTIQFIEIPLFVNEIAGNDPMKAFVNIFINDGSQESHWFQEISVTNKPMVYKGMAIVTEHENINSQAYFYDANGIETAHTTWLGTTTQALSINQSDLLLVSTHTPENLLAIRFDDQEYEWTKQAPIPNPDFTCLQHTTPYLYYGVGAGRIVSVYASTGLQFNQTEIFDNYLATSITVNSDKLVFAQESRIGQSGRITTCYKSTGALQYHYLTDLKSVYSSQFALSENIVFIGNKASAGTILLFDPNENTILKSFDVQFGPITNATTIDGNSFLVTNSHSVFLFNITSESTQLLYTSEDEITTIKYDEMVNQVYLIIEKEILVYGYPNFTLKERLTFPDQVKSIGLRYLR